MLVRDLLQSLDRQRRVLQASVILTPVDNEPLELVLRSRAAFLHGLYATDKQHRAQDLQDAVILTAGRKRATRDLGRIYGLLAERLGGTAASMRLLSGLHAHTVVLMSLAQMGDRVMMLPERAGGHFSVAGIAQRLGLKVCFAACDNARMMIDRTATLAAVKKYRPAIILVDRSEGLKYEDFEFLGQLSGPLKIFDSSQYLPQIICGAYANPFDWGFDLQVFSLHKSFPGPQKAGVVARACGPAWERCLRGLGSYVSSHHVESAYMAGFALADLTALTEYVSRMLRCVKVLEATLAGGGTPVVRAASQGVGNWPRTQHIWIKLGEQRRALEVWRALGRCRIQTNYRLLPYQQGWGLRLGVAHAVTRGLNEDVAAQLGAIIARVAQYGPSLDMRHRVRGIAEALRPLTISQQETCTHGK